MSDNESAYVSHLIRGTLGANATKDDELANIQLAIDFAAQLRTAYPGWISMCQRSIMSS